MSALALAVPVLAFTICAGNQNCEKGDFFIVGCIDRIESDSVLRVGGSLIGKPHTSNRIDRILLVSGNDTIVANDIDGIDFNRYYQWEDNGQIAVEIDFPITGTLASHGLTDDSKLIFETVRENIIIDRLN